MLIILLSFYLSDILNSGLLLGVFLDCGISTFTQVKDVKLDKKILKKERKIYLFVKTDTSRKNLYFTPVEQKSANTADSAPTVFKKKKKEAFKVCERL